MNPMQKSHHPCMNQSYSTLSITNTDHPRQESAQWELTNKENVPHLLCRETVGALPAQFRED